MRVFAVILLLTLPLGGCVSLTAAGVATAVALGVTSGVGKYAGERATRGAHNLWIRQKKCGRLRTAEFRGKCLNRMRALQHEYRS